MSYARRVAGWTQSATPLVAGITSDGPYVELAAARSTSSQSYAGLYAVCAYPKAS
jgi:hypothetical protein